MSVLISILPPEDLTGKFADYAGRLSGVLKSQDWAGVSTLGHDLLDAWKTRRQVFLCGNGGSAGNAAHLANDLIYGVSGEAGSGIRAHALSANSSVLTCLANDVGYDSIYSAQLGVMADPDDILIVFSGSGNSPNIVNALEEARRIGMKTYAVVGYSGGRARELAEYPIHFAIDDMQISEDLQLVVGHMVMQHLRSVSEEKTPAPNQIQHQ